MVQDNKATLTYTQLLKEDLGIFRLVPEDGVIPDYKPGQFLTIGMQYQVKIIKLLDVHIQLRHTQKIKNSLSL